jgi:hypothetical protein
VGLRVIKVATLKFLEVVFLQLPLKAAVEVVLVEMPLNLQVVVVQVAVVMVAVKEVVVLVGLLLLLDKVTQVVQGFTLPMQTTALAVVAVVLVLLEEMQVAHRAAMVETEVLLPIQVVL